MHPYLLHEVRMDDLAARYQTAERHRHAALVKHGVERMGTAWPDSLPGDHPAPRPGATQWIVGLFAAVALITLMIVTASCTSPALPAVAVPDATTQGSTKPAASAPDPSAPETTTLLITHSDAAISVPETIPAGRRLITIQNRGDEWHASIFRRLNDDVTMEQFTAAFAESPFGSLSLTTQLGGPDLPPGGSADTVFEFLPGHYALVDNWTEPPRFTAFTVVDSAEAGGSLLPVAVAVQMREHEFVMPETIKTGPQWWEFRNTGQALHQMGIVKLQEGKTLDDISSWLDAEEGPPPWEDVAFWNVMSPGQHSWGVLDLPPGAYLALDFLPDPTHDGAPNFALGMSREITVTE